jgi:hypothetical protein
MGTVTVVLLLTFLGTVLGAFAAYYAGTRTPMGTVIAILLWMLLGAVLGAFAGYFGGVAYGELANVSNREGMYGYAVVFGMAPAGAGLGALAGLILGIVRWQRRRRSAVRRDGASGD